MTPPRHSRTPQLREPARRVRTRVSPDSPRTVRTRLRHAPFPRLGARSFRPAAQGPLWRGAPSGRGRDAGYSHLPPPQPSAPASPQPQRRLRRCPRLGSLASSSLVGGKRVGGRGTRRSGMGCTSGLSISTGRSGAEGRGGVGWWGEVSPVWRSQAVGRTSWRCPPQGRASLLFKVKFSCRRADQDVPPARWPRRSGRLGASGDPSQEVWTLESVYHLYLD